jgi:hypothetical protein
MEKWRQILSGSDMKVIENDMLLHSMMVYSMMVVAAAK